MSKLSKLQHSNDSTDSSAMQWLNALERLAQSMAMFGIAPIESLYV